MGTNAAPDNAASDNAASDNAAPDNAAPVNPAPDNPAPDNPAASAQASVQASTKVSAQASAQASAPIRLSGELARLRALFRERPVRLREIIAVLRQRAWLLVILLCALPFCVPLSVPGVSTPFGLAAALIALALARGREPKLSDKTLDRRLPPGFFGKLTGFTGGLVRWLEKWQRPRLASVMGSPALMRLHGAGLLASSLVLMLPLPVPFSNTLPAIGVLLVAGGLLERDGLCVLAGHAMFLASVLYLTLWGHAAVELVHYLWD
ncbi:MAG: exopolysaccharide biosynthesis protein [Opitutaceae bacterium]|nr:exopolysaccharide biosynthesis protein [Opitutaceae bacterium]